MSDLGNSTKGPQTAAPFPIVAIGASAGGLEAMRQLFAALPGNTGMAFVVIQHLDPARPSMLSAVLATDSKLPVVEVTGAVQVEIDRVYVIPPESDLTIQNGIVSLVPRSRSRKLHLPIDTFFRALAEDSGAHAIGVVLSGSASDGTDGLRAIKAAGGITFAQEPSSAQFPSMPESAITAGVVDFTLQPQAIAREIARLSSHPYLADAHYPRELGANVEGSAPESPEPAAAITEDNAELATILLLTRRHTHFDFRDYKRSTVFRRIAKRMALARVTSMGEYADLLRSSPAECTALAEDILIHVTSFFRDPDTFDSLSQNALPALLAHKVENPSWRIWVPGCSTGEEVYSLAILLVEFLAERDLPINIKIFGSDLSERAIEKARSGGYSDAEVEGLSPERLSRFFERSNGRFRIGSMIRDLCVFVRHDLAFDPPFARLDVISCRNVLIYFNADLQRRILPLLHHCLNKPGYLILGGSEGIGEFRYLFEPVVGGHRIFVRTGESPSMQYPVSLGREAESMIPLLLPSKRLHPSRDAQRQADHVLLARYAPPGVVVNDSFQVVQFRGRTGEYLEAPPGQPQMNVLQMARHGIAGPLRQALERSKSERTAVRELGVQLGDDGEGRSINLVVIPLAGLAAGSDTYFLVVFEEEAVLSIPSDTQSSTPQVAREARPRSGGGVDAEVARIKAELAATQTYLQALTADHQDTTDELGAANEELIAGNEELQSTNEELQSAKEELQSANEELVTLNEELGVRNVELDTVANDLVNVLESVKIPVIIVDRDMRVRRFTPTALEISSLWPGDVGRPIDDIKLKLQISDLSARIKSTIESLTPSECEVQDLDNRWYRLHIRPYRTSENRLDGAVLTFLDVDVLKRAVEEAEHAREYAEGIVATVPMSLVVLDSNMRILSANPPFRRIFADTGSAIEGMQIFDVASRALNVPELRHAAESSLSDCVAFQELEFDCVLKGDDTRHFVLSGCPIPDAGGGNTLLLAMEDITERRLLEASETRARLEAVQANRAKDLFLATLSHELRTPLNTILISAQLLEASANADGRIRRASAAIQRAVSSQARLIDDLLDVSRIVSGKLMLDLQAVDLETVVQSAVDLAQPSADAKMLKLDLSLSGTFRPVHGDPARLQQVLTNLLTNAIKFTPPGGKITVSVEATKDEAVLKVADTGLGMRQEIIPHLFNRFVQAESAMTRAYGGLGLGLAIVRHIVHVHGGHVSAESAGEGMGSTFTVTLPLSSHDWVVTEANSRSVAKSIDGIRVLLIEDDDDTREACGAMLAMKGADVRTAASTAAGLELLTTFLPQVILCDIAIPGEDGYAFVRKLRSGSVSSAVPAAALTALAGEEDRKMALKAGFQMHIAKPVDSDTLAVAVASLASWPYEVKAVVS